MPRSRTIKTLVVLLGAMTVGTFVLIGMEPGHFPGATHAQVPGLTVRSNQADTDRAIDSIYRSTGSPIVYGRWRCIVIHDSVGSLTGNAIDGVHFRIYGHDDPERDGQIEVTGHWQNQQAGWHTSVPGDPDFGLSSIGICLVGDMARRPPSAAQMASLNSLVRSLQARLDISREYVYTQRNITGEASPGRLFQEEEFRRHLLPAGR